MIKKCPHCDRQVPPDEYFCPDCGEALFPGDTSAREDGSANPIKTEQLDGFQQEERQVLATLPGRTPDYGHAPLFVSPYEPRTTLPPRRLRIPWGGIVGVLVVVIIVAVGYSMYVYLRGPGIKVSPPAGWSEADDGEKKSIENSMNESGSIDYDLDYLFISDGNGIDEIVVFHFDADPEEEPFPETQDLEEIGKYIDKLEEYGYIPGAIVNIYELRNMLDGARPIHLGCGQACIYIEENPEGVGAFETLVVGKDRRVFMVFVLKALADGFPSQEMQYLIDTIELD